MDTLYMKYIIYMKYMNIIYEIYISLCYVFVYYIPNAALSVVAGEAVTV